MGIVIDYTSGFFEAAPSGEAVGNVTGNATLDLSSGNVFNHTPTANTTFVFSNPPASGTAYGMTLKVTGANVVDGYDLANASYDSVSFSVATDEGSPTGLFFSSDGTKMYVTGFGFDRVYEYQLSTAFDISTASSYNSYISVSSQTSLPTDVTFSNVGTKMYITGGSTVFQYSLSTAFDISTASYDSVSFSASAQETAVSDVSFNPTGTKMFIVGYFNDNVHQYSLSTGFDVSTASYDSVSFSVSTQDNTPTGITFNSNGTKMFIIGQGSDAVYQYSLSTGFDISTASYDNVSFSVSTQENSPRSIAFSADGGKMYIVGLTNDTIYQYSTGTSALATLTYPASVDWPSGTAPTAPASGETDVYTFYTTDGGTTYYGFQVGDAMA